MKVFQDHLSPYRREVLRMICVSWRRSFLYECFGGENQAQSWILQINYRAPCSFLRIIIIHNHKHDVSRNLRLGIERSVL